ncbi:MAG: hypothetical protein ABSD48_08070 [Armatimonadota bacterium]|jgi:hypothetical protein
MNDADMDKRVLLPKRVREQLVRDWKSLEPIVAYIAELVEKVSDEQLAEMIWQLRGTLACMLYRAVN